MILHCYCFYTDSLCSRSDKVVKLKVSWQENIVQFEKMKSDLRERQVCFNRKLSIEIIGTFLYIFLKK